MKVMIPMEIKYKVMFERMRAKVRVDYETDCWNWVGATAGNGYPKFRRPAKWYGRREVEPAHRGMYEIYFGPVDSSLHLDHLCRNKKCVNPYHLEPVTHAENIRRGNTAKLRNSQVRSIKEMLRNGVYITEISNKLGVSYNCIRDIKYGRTWKGVE